LHYKSITEICLDPFSSKLAQVQHQNSQLSFQTISLIYKRKMSGVMTAGETTPVTPPKGHYDSRFLFQNKKKNTPK